MISSNKFLRFLRVFLTGIILILFIPAKATHIVGGELTYKHLNNNQYVISLIVYRDCYNGVPQLDNPAYVFIYDGFNNLDTIIAMVLDSSAIIPSTVNSPCFIPPSDVCYERSYYRSQTITLAPSISGYQLAYQRCCRNNTILNIVQPGATGATFYAFIPGTSTFSQNSNPVYDSLPPPFICLGVPFVFDHSATDIDSNFINGTWVHDVIEYELCNPFNGADTINPIPNPGQLPAPPPYVAINWNPPFSQTNIVSANPLFVIDSVTGIITGTPNLLGQYVVAVCAKEFRDGIYLSTSRRDFQLNVVPCPTLVIAAIQNPLIICGSNAVTFQNFSVNAGSYDWDFGVAGSNADTSHVTTPTFVYPDTGIYTVTLVAHSVTNAACTDTTRGTVYIQPDYIPTFTHTKQPCTNTYSFTDTSNLDSGPTISWQWNFGDGDTSSQHNPVHSYIPGNYTVTLMGRSSKGCIKTIYQTLQVFPLLSISSRSIDPPTCAGDCNATAIVLSQNGIAPYSYQWSDPLAQTTETADSLCKGSYQVIVIDSNACADTLNITIVEPLPLVMQVTSTLAYCNGACIGSALATASGGNGGYTFQWNDTLQQNTPLSTALCPGIYTVVINDSRNCTIRDLVTILLSDSLPPLIAFTDKDTLYSGQSAQLNAVPSNTYTYSWNPPLSLNSYVIPNPVSTPASSIDYIVMITDSNGCVNLDSVRIVVLDITCKEPEIFIPNAFTPDNNQSNDVLRVRGTTIEKIFFAVYDRWGDKVFESNDQQLGWDGIYKGKAAHTGVYVYYLEATCWDKQQFFKKGNVTLLK